MRGMAEDRPAVRVWLHRLYTAYGVCAALLFVVTWVLLMGWREVVPNWLIAVSFGAAALAALIGHFVEGRENWSDY